MLNYETKDIQSSLKSRTIGEVWRLFDKVKDPLEVKYDVNIKSNGKLVIITIANDSIRKTVAYSGNETVNTDVLIISLEDKNVMISVDEAYKIIGDIA